MTELFSPIQQRMLVVLSDGRPHSREELRQCLADDLAQAASVSYHIALIRRALRPQGQDLICEYDRRRRFYRHVRLLASPYDGQR